VRSRCLLLPLHLGTLRNHFPVTPHKDILTSRTLALKTNTQIVQQQPILHHGNLLFLIIRFSPVTAVEHAAWPSVIAVL
jgi:hypothetical protein